MSKRNLIVSVICTLLIALWSYAALSKISEFTTFGDQLILQPVPKWSVPVIKWSLPIVELGIAALIYFQRTRVKGLILSTILMIVFTFYVLFALTGAFGEIPCSCAGLISGLHWKGHLVFNICFTILSLTGTILVKLKYDNYIRQSVMSI